MNFARTRRKQTWLRIARLCILVLLAPGPPASAIARKNIAFARAEHLRRGINLSLWYAQDRELYNATGGAEKLASFTTENDFRLIRELGFDHVRLSIDPQPLIANPASGTLRPEAMARLDLSIRQITATGLVVVLDIHPDAPWKHAVTQTPDGATQFLAFWKNFAHHYAGSDPERVYLEVLNEPEGVDPHEWQEEQAKAVAIIRAQAPRHTIIVTGDNWSDIDGLRRIEPLRETNVIYSFHDYEPMMFSHQGATWSWGPLRDLRNVPYPSTPENIAPLLPSLKDAAARTGLARYGEQRWNADRIAQRLGDAVAWARQRHVPLWCGEFGVYLKYAPPADRYRWMRDMRTTLERNGVGWCMWDYQTNFGLVAKSNGSTTVDEEAAKALGVGR